MISSRVSLPAVHQNPETPARRSLPPISEMFSDIQLKRHHPPQQGYYASLHSKSMADRNEPVGTAYDRVYHDYRSASGDRRQHLAPAPQPDQVSHMPAVYSTPQSQTQIGLIHYDPSRGGCAEFLPTHFMNWSYQQFFSRIRYFSGTIANFAEACSRDDQQHLPSELEVGGMIANVDSIKREIDQYQLFIQSAKRVRERNTGDDTVEVTRNVHMYSDSTEFPPHKVVKKQRVRPTRPGHCHECKLTASSEWRYGPNGPGTLCNACGLRYGKLERKRKRQLEAQPLPAKKT
ncbi:sexual development transcription factor NsdD [Akanthomyces lecanii RCEF 1005]|uniref:Sexual development transcription factor NsdD n=1 Tax=Akanthomyces lecanii RCEF 1005 TaxID=1081108 RepID=A0A167TSA0_CORDF|nr:sexual development transcription factor NsdD [Akanthomyces lecanii RCEF 1005]